MKYNYSTALKAQFELLEEGGLGYITNYCKTCKLSDNSSETREIFSWRVILRGLLDSIKVDENINVLIKMLDVVFLVPMKYKASVLSWIKYTYNNIYEKYGSIIEKAGSSSLMG